MQTASAFWDRLDIPMPPTLPELARLTWKDLCPDIPNGQVLIIFVQVPAPEELALIPPALHHAVTLLLGPGARRHPMHSCQWTVAPHGAALESPAFWDSLYHDKCPNIDAFLIVASAMAIAYPAESRWDAERLVPATNRAWEVCGRRLPMGCRRAMLWIPGPGAGLRCPTAVSDADPIHLPARSELGQICLTTGVLPFPGNACFWKNGAWCLFGPDAGPDLALFSAIYLLSLHLTEDANRLVVPVGGNAGSSGQPRCRLPPGRTATAGAYPAAASSCHLGL
ncbi:MAG: hypothetical protein VYB61_05225 [Verrucomicrobiota bacterium]|nr:hypothetical protein [Verrucomicrobiota bacterium]